MPRLKFLSKPLAKIRQHRHETKAALLTTEFGWHYKFDLRSNITVQKRRCFFLLFLKDGLRKFYD